VTFLTFKSTKTTYGQSGHRHQSYWHPRQEEKKSTLRHPPREISTTLMLLKQYSLNLTSSKNPASLSQCTIKLTQQTQPKQKSLLANLKQLT
jgi:hypothetical protein